MSQNALHTTSLRDDITDTNYRARNMMGGGGAGRGAGGGAGGGAQ